MEKLRNVAQKFQLSGQFAEAHLCQSGHINDTYVVSCRVEDGSQVRYILQRINQNVFKNPEEVMANIQAVTAHLRRKIVENGGDPERETLNLIPTWEGAIYVVEDGEVWRAYKFIEGAQTYQVVQNPAHFYHAGKAFGRFQQHSQDFPRKRSTRPFLTSTILPSVWKTSASGRTNRCGRLKEVQQEVEFVLSRAEDTKPVEEGIASGSIRALPQRHQV